MTKKVVLSFSRTAFVMLFVANDFKDEIHICKDRDIGFVC